MWRGWRKVEFQIFRKLRVGTSLRRNWLMSETWKSLWKSSVTRMTWKREDVTLGWKIYFLKITWKLKDRVIEMCIVVEVFQPHSTEKHHPNNDNPLPLLMYMHAIHLIVYFIYTKSTEEEVFRRREKSGNFSLMLSIPCTRHWEIKSRYKRWTARRASTNDEMKT